MQAALRYLGFPAACATTSYLYTIFHDDISKIVPNIKKIQPLTPKGEGAAAAGCIAFVSNIVCTSPVLKVATTIGGISALALGLKYRQERQHLERYKKQTRDDF